jgi:hypothetical protein
VPLRACGRCGSLQNLILKGHAFGTVFLEPGFRGVGGGEDLDVLGIADLLACVDVDKTVIARSCGQPVPMRLCSKSGRTSAPRRPQALQVNFGSRLDRRTSSPQPSAFTTTE